ncbi:MAG TPA: twin-arginine translocase subunit TatC [Rhodanobacteraceae bacterium]
MATPEEDPKQATGADEGFDLEQGIFSHLIELRSRLIKALVCVLVVLVCLVPFADKIYGWLADPLVRQLPKGAHLIAVQVTSPFVTPLKMAVYLAIFISVPWIVYQAWAFVSPGLYRHEKRLARPLLVASILLFYAGCAFAYFLVLPPAFRFLVAVTPNGVEMMTDITHYLHFVVMIFFAFGVCFEIPVVQVIVAAAGLVTLKRLKSWRRYAVVASAVVSAVLTPPNIVSMLLLMIPMMLLYELGLVAVRILVKPKPASVGEVSG